MRGGEQSGLVGGDAVAERALEVEGAGKPVLGSADRQLDEAGAAHVGLRVVRVRPVRAGRVGGGRVAGEAAPGHRADPGQHRGERTHEGRLRGALLAAREHPADHRVDGVEDESEAQILLAEHGRERELRIGRLRGPGRERRGNGHSEVPSFFREPTPDRAS